MTHPLKGLKALVTAGPTHEQIDPVRFIGNRSSGKQGYAIARSLADAGADVTLVSGPCHIDAPETLNTINVQTADEMFEGCMSALPVDIAVCAAAVADWKPVYSENKIKKRDHALPSLSFTENPDILKTIGHHSKRPKLVIGFAAETNDLIAHATLKLNSKNADWILANQVDENLFGGDENHVYLVSHTETIEWPRCTKLKIAQQLTDTITEFFKCH